MVQGSAWKYVSNDDEHIYRIQVNNVDGSNINIVENSLSDWKPSGEGWNDNGQILFFLKRFENPEQWEEWINKFKYFNLSILDRDGKTKKKIQCEEITPSHSVRVCSKCNKPGHNARTCAQFTRKNTVITNIVPQVTVDAEKGKKTCSICNQKGHNARSCKNK